MFFLLAILLAASGPAMAETSASEAVRLIHRVSLVGLPPGRAQNDAPVPALEFSVAPNADLPVGTSHSVISQRIPSQVACTSNGDVLAVVDVAKSKNQLLIPGNEPQPVLKVWRLSPTTGTHTLNKALEKFRPLAALKLSPDGRYAAVTGKRKSALLSVETGEEVPGVQGTDNLARIPFSSNGNFVAFTRPGAGIVLFDIASGKVTATVAAMQSPGWISPDGKLFAAKKTDGPEGIFDANGKQLYPAAKGDAPLAFASSVTRNADGSRLALLTKDGDPARYTAVIFAMPGWNRLREFPVGEETSSPIALHLSGDGRVLATQRFDEADNLKTAFFETESGSSIVAPDRLQGGPLGLCGNHQLWHSWLLPQPKGAPSEGARFRTDIVDPMATLLAPPAQEKIAADAPTGAAALALHDATRAWRALAAMKQAGTTRAAAEKALALLPATGLNAADGILLKNLETRLGGAFKGREAAVVDVRALFTRITVAQYEELVAPVLAAASGSSDLEIHNRADRLISYWRERTPGRASAEVLASRLGLLP